MDCDQCSPKMCRSVDQRLKIITIVGARPQFIKASVLSAELIRRDHDEVLVHTGQHYDYEMSQVFFEDLDIRPPNYHLNVGSASPGAQTAEILKRLEPIVAEEQADWVVVFGDTNSTLAGALAAAKHGTPLAHVEAGLRSYNRAMPEEINRIVTDHVANLHLAPTHNAVQILAKEGIVDTVEMVGDLMVDLLHHVASTMPDNPEVLKRLRLKSKTYALMTVHRVANTDDAAVLTDILNAAGRLPLTVVFPVHPRTLNALNALPVKPANNIILCSPLPYREMVCLQVHASVILTDSGGVQKEAYTLAVPCVTLRSETEWIETLADGWNVLSGHNPELILNAALRIPPSVRPMKMFGHGESSKLIAHALERRADRTRSERMLSAI